MYEIQSPPPLRSEVYDNWGVVNEENSELVNDKNKSMLL